MIVTRTVIVAASLATLVFAARADTARA